MSAFVWIDRDGRRHELGSPAPIEAEATALASEMDGCVALLDSPERQIRDPARAALRQLQLRLEQLRADLARWNEHAVAMTRLEAAKLAKEIERLPTMIADAVLVVSLHDEHDLILKATAGAPDTRARVLAGPATPLQRRAVAACSSRTPPPDTATRGEAKAWLDAQPKFARDVRVDGGWFDWTDRAGHAHRLASPLAIEREAAVIAAELAKLRPALVAGDDPAALYKALNLGVASWERLRSLKSELERFDREHEAREDAAWTAYAADWRSKRKM